MYFNTANGVLSKQRSGPAISPFEFYANSKVPLELVVNDVGPVPDAAREIKFGITKASDGAILALASTWVKESTGRFTSTLNFRTDEAAAAMVSGETLDIKAQILIQATGYGPFRSQVATGELRDSTIDFDDPAPTESIPLTDYLTL